MSSFWQSYIEMIQIFFDYLRSIRLGDWDLSQKPSGLMLPWFHVYDRQNYADTLLTVGQADINFLLLIPVFTLSLSKGNFSVRRSAGRFNKLPPDQVIEQRSKRVRRYYWIQYFRGNDPKMDHHKPCSSKIAW